MGRIEVNGTDRTDKLSFFSYIEKYFQKLKLK
jgi:hypothetical protein